VRQGQSDGLAVVDITLAVSGQHLSQLHIQIEGQPLAEGGVQMTSSRVTLGNATDPGTFAGRIVSLQGTDVQAELSDRMGAGLTLVARLRIDGETGNVGGTVTVSPSAGASG
jgi:hypothetical protein